MFRFGLFALLCVQFAVGFVEAVTTDEFDQRVHALEITFTKTNNIVNVLNSTTTYLEDLVDHIFQSVARSSRQIWDLKKAAKTQDDTIKRLENSIKTVRDTQALTKQQLEAELNNTNNAVNALNTKNKELQQTVTNATLTIQTLETSINTLTVKNQQLAAENIALKKNITKLVGTTKELEDNLNQAKHAQDATNKHLANDINNAREAQVAGKIELEYDIIESTRKLRRDQNAWKYKIFMKHSHAEDGTTAFNTATRVNVASATMSSVHDMDYTADKATDGNLGTVCRTHDEVTPWYRAELGVRFTAIKLDIRMYDYLNVIFTVYTVDNGVETECATKDQRGGLYYYRWIVLCPNAGDGFKISGRSTDIEGRTLVLMLYEITVDIQI